MRLIAFLWLAAASLSAQRPHYGGALTVETRLPIASLQPAEMPSEFSALVFERLVELDDSGTPRPGLAVSWSHDSSRRRWQFRIAERVTAHDGSLLTAQAAAAALTPLLPGRAVGATQDNVVIQSADPSARLLFELARPRNAIVLRNASGGVAGTGPFRVAAFDPGRRLSLAAHDAYRAGRPFLDTVEILASRTHAEQLRDFELGRAHAVELLPADVRRQQQRGRRVWVSPPQRTVALVWKRDRPAAQNAALRRALALSIDRAPMLNVLMQRQGEATGALLPQWLTGYAFLFPSTRDLAAARPLASGAGPVLMESSPELRSLADRVALNARDAGISVRAVSAGPADVALVLLPPVSPDAATALADIAQAVGASVDVDSDAPEALVQAERRLLDGHWIVPLVHAPAILGLGTQVRDRTPARALRWRIEDAWLQP